MGRGGEEMANFVAASNRWSAPMPQPNDLEQVIALMRLVATNEPVLGLDPPS